MAAEKTGATAQKTSIPAGLAKAMSSHYVKELNRLIQAQQESYPADSRQALDFIQAQLVLLTKHCIAQNPTLPLHIEIIFTALETAANILARQDFSSSDRSRLPLATRIILYGVLTACLKNKASSARLSCQLLTATSTYLQTHPEASTTFNEAQIQLIRKAVEHASFHAHPESSKLVCTFSKKLEKTTSPLLSVSPPSPRR